MKPVDGLKREKEYIKMMVYGVDSAIASNTQLTNGYRLYDWVMRQNSNPDFWGRTLLGHDPITREEIDYLQGKKCRIALVIRDLTEAGVSTYEGEPDALRAVEAAKGLGVPEHAGIALFAEIHSDWSINHNWMISFAQTLFENGYIPGFIGNTDSARNFNFDRQCSHYVQATGDYDCFNAVYWATEPKVEGEPGEWSPFCPSALSPEDIGLWQCGSLVFGSKEVGQVYGRDETLLNRMW